MQKISTSSANHHFIKSWFGFFIGLVSVTLSIISLLDGFTWSRVLSVLGFLCFWYPWTQLTGFNQPIKNLFNTENHKMSKLCNYLAVIAALLLISSTIIRFTH